MLAAGAAESSQRILGHVVAALHRDALDRLGHVAHGDLQETFGQLLGAHLAPRGRPHLLGHGREARAHRRHIQRLVGIGAEHAGEEVGLDLAQQDVAVGHRQRAAAPVARGPRIGAGRIGADAQPGAIEMQDGSPTGRHGMDAHHRRAHAHAGHQRLELALELAGVMRHVGGRAAHVEADHAVKARQLAGADHADDTAGRAGQDGVLAAETVRVGQAAAGLHEHQAHARQLAAHLLDIAHENGRQIGIDHRGVAARDKLDQRTGLVRGRHLRKADLARDGGGALLMHALLPGVHEHDGDGADAIVEHAPQVGAQAVLRQRAHHRAVGSEPFVGLDHRLVQHLGQLHVAVEQARPTLVGNAQRVAESPRGHQQGALALAFEQGIGRHRGAHLDALDLVGRHRLARRDAQQLADAGHRSVAVLLGVLRQHLGGHGGAVWPARHDIGERASTVNPELPLHSVLGLAGVTGGKAAPRPAGARRCMMDLQ
ncbi:Uncharacterised protein [Bordetella pertussis]|nr:Uncharacterised protein [Bordetella pertussis]